LKKEDGTALLPAWNLAVETASNSNDKAVVSIRFSEKAYSRHFDEARFLIELENVGVQKEEIGIFIRPDGYHHSSRMAGGDSKPEPLV
jgi:hypothetical protein